MERILNRRGGGADGAVAHWPRIHADGDDECRAWWHAFEFTPLKERCLVHCRSPLEWIPRHRRPGQLGAFRMGVEHGAYCVGCCWALMLLLFVGGVMNLIWVAFLATIVLVQKVLPGGVTLARFVGVVLGRRS
ncbi:DUF2182 domain-containing protein [Bradyrhizobium sp. AUGA SZCCT0283]|nr:DUF2182 domain-containing protein [Bradyrhizobium sp. AUGA SZCCT0283]